MAEKTLKALAIKSKSNPPGKSEYKWDVIPEIDNFTKGIVIPELGIEKDGTAKVDIGAIVSGMPTVYARANLFKNALDNVTDKDAEASGLMLFYKNLINEWRGLISCIALNYKDIEIQRLRLQYSDGKSIFETENLYEPLGAFGNMLFERKPLWCDQTLASNDERIPFIDIITFNGKVIGATSPDSLLFTSVGYKLSEKLPFVNVNSGKLIDPLLSDIQPEQLLAIHAFVQHVVNKTDAFKNTFNNLDNFLKPNYSSIYGNMQDWLKEMDTYAYKRGWVKPSQKPGSTPEVNKFIAPFSILFNHSTELYGLEGVIYSETGNDGRISFKPSELLLPETTEIIQFRLGTDAEKNKDFLATRPLMMLRADVKGMPSNYAYFTLPLTPHALNVFGNNLSALTGIADASEVKSRLSAEYEVDNMGEYLNVRLRLHSQTGNENVIDVKYKVAGEVKGRDILLWPNFISKKWNRYFMYNEIPHNDIKFQASPFIGDINDQHFRIVLNDKNEPLYLAKDGKLQELNNPDYKSSLLVENNQKVSDNPYKYEIYESNQPFKGIKFSYGKSDNLCGFVIIRYDKLNKVKELPKDMTNEMQNLADARLGIDFGSTNSSVAYWSDRDNEVKGMTLRNRRISLLASDNKNNDERPAVEDEVFFFQNDEIKTNAIKSVLAIHDFKRLSNLSSLPQEQLLEKEIIGGFPCFEKNLPIETSDNTKHTLKFNRAGIAELKYNMKWSSNPLEKGHKKAYLSSLMLHIYAQLFEEGHEPTSLKWSYPSSMVGDILNQYRGIYDSLSEISPIVEPKRLLVCPPDIQGNTNGDENTWAGSNTGSSWGGVSETSENTVNTWGDSGNSWGSPTPNPNNTAGGWGNQGSSKSKSVVEIKIDNGPLKFDFRPLDDNESLTESCAVANYFLEDLPVRPGELLMIFDVGGSTTDISVLSQMEGGGKAMIKQNSIRWAAQRLAFATRYSKNFQSVLLRMCEKKKIKIEGLNTTPSKYNENTAPFYFEQLIDRLEDSDFPDFYRLIAAECKELMSVNLYVTGLIMYYAGQLTLKMREEMLRSEDVPVIVKNMPPKIYIAFAGKGARIFDWFDAINPKAANEYYTQMFIRGIGGMERAKSTITPINFPSDIIKINAFKKENNADVKYEVSKGLAIPTFKSKILVPKEKQAIEILGEEGFCVYTPSGEMKYLDFSNSVTPEMMEHLGAYFVNNPQPGKPPCPRFMDFADLFYKVSSSTFGFNMKQEEFIAGFNNMNIEAAIKQDPDYIEAQKKRKETKEFGYVAPIFVMEGIKFFEERILKAIKN
jgi:hypothetical protein